MRKVIVTKHYAPMVPVYQFLSQVSSLIFILTPVLLDLWILCIEKTVNICRLEMSALSRKPSRSNSTTPYSISVYNFKYTNSP